MISRTPNLGVGRVFKCTHIFIYILNSIEIIFRCFMYNVHVFFVSPGIVFYSSIYIFEKTDNSKPVYHLCCIASSVFAIYHQKILNRWNSLLCTP